MFYVHQHALPLFTPLMTAGPSYKSYCLNPNAQLDKCIADENIIV